MIGVTMGVNNLLELFNEKYYEDLEGGILESFGRLFRNSVKLYIYPMRQDVFARYLNGGAASASSAPSVLITAKNLQVATSLRNLYQHLLENRYIECAVGYDEAISGIFSRESITKIRERDSGWEQMVPPRVAEIIKQKNLFGYSG
jgi:hypothetical protein